MIRMQRTKRKNTVPPTCICTGDWHLRESTPACRTDNFWEAQWKKVAFVRDLQIKYQCPVIHSGDLFDHWKPSPYLLSQAFKNLPDQFWTIYGNHDLPYHALENAYKSGVDTLLAGGRITMLSGVHWEQTPQENSGILFPRMETDRKMLVWHVMTYTGKLPWPGCTDTHADKLLQQYPQFDIILTGHNHKFFVAQDGNRLLLNPGSLTRQTADQIDHKPSVFLYSAETNAIERIFLPIEKEVMSREHIAVKERRDKRIEVFVEHLKREWESDTPGKKEISFEKNLERVLHSSKNILSKDVITIIHKAIETP